MWFGLGQGVGGVDEHGGIVGTVIAKGGANVAGSAGTLSGKSNAHR